MDAEDLNFVGEGILFVVEEDAFSMIDGTRIVVVLFIELGQYMLSRK
jgi:hypothetical protein